MSVDYAKKERAFLDALKADTGHSLDEWLALIGAEKLQERNDIIDWLRQHGFTFSRASWLERIHHNGGTPIYAATTSDAAATLDARKDPSPSSPHLQDGGEPERPPEGEPERDHTEDKQKTELRVHSAGAAPGPQLSSASPDTTDIDKTLARAKGLRPLAQHVLGKLKTVVPDVAITARKSALVLSTEDRAFGLLVVSSRDLRLGLVLASGPPEAPFEPPHFAANQARILQNVTHMLVLDDVRQITPEVLTRIQNAATTV